MVGIIRRVSWVLFGSFGSRIGPSWAVLVHFDAALGLSGECFGMSLLAEAVWRSVSLLGAVKVDGP